MVWSFPPVLTAYMTRLQFLPSHGGREVTVVISGLGTAPLFVAFGDDDVVVELVLVTTAVVVAATTTTLLQLLLLSLLLTTNTTTTTTTTHHGCPSRARKTSVTPKRSN